MNKLIIWLALSTLIIGTTLFPSCGLTERHFCREASRVNIFKQLDIPNDGWGWAEWSCRGDTDTILIYTEIPATYMRTVILHELIHIYGRIATHPTDENCFFYDTARRAIIPNYTTFGDVPPCPYELEIMRGKASSGRKMTIVIWEQNNEWIDHVVWSIAYWNYWIGEDVFTLEFAN